MVFTGLILLGVFNGLVFLPVLLLMVGPPAEVVPKDGAQGDAVHAQESPKEEAADRVQQAGRRAQHKPNGSKAKGGGQSGSVGVKAVK